MCYVLDAFKPATDCIFISWLKIMKYLRNPCDSSLLIRITITNTSNTLVHIHTYIKFL